MFSFMQLGKSLRSCGRSLSLVAVTSLRASFSSPCHLLQTTPALRESAKSSIFSRIAMIHCSVMRGELTVRSDILRR
jgi:hypothetical protein